mgnify:CR=1 FL=1
MKVNKNSWHYRAITEETLGVTGVGSNFVSSSLCIYFWQVVSSIVFKGAVLLGVLPVVLAVSVVLPLSSLVGSMVTGNIIGGDLGLIILLAEMVATMVGLLLLGCGALIDKYRDYRYEKFMEEPIDKEPSLVAQYIKAKKDKICPIIEFVEEE